MRWIRSTVVLSIFLFYLVVRAVSLDGFKQLLLGMGRGLALPLLLIVAFALMEHAEIDHRPGLKQFLQGALGLVFLAVSGELLYTCLVPLLTAKISLGQTVGLALGLLAWSVYLDRLRRSKTTPKQRLIQPSALPPRPKSSNVRLL